jgi:choline dehydrogenase
MTEFDYIVVGAGSAGCALAARLTERPGVRVLLLEAGGDDRVLHNPGQALVNGMIAVPAGVARLMESKRINWGYETEPESGSGRVYVYPRGKVLGGSSSINGMIYARGQHADYDHWLQLGCTGWGWSDVAPYFKRMETNSRGETELRGGYGPVSVSDITGILPVSRAATRACMATGIPPSDDINGASQEGVTLLQLTTHNGRRASSSAAYLRPAMKRPNLCVETHALVERVSFEGKRATGIVYRQGRQRREARARAEVILCGGAINGPQILERSGIGDAGLLASLGVQSLVHRPEVGENFQDHFNAPLQFRLKPDVLAFGQMQKGWRALATIFEYMTRRTGLLAGSVGQVVAYSKTAPHLSDPDFKILFMLVATTVKKIRGRHTLAMDPNPGLTMLTCQLRPESKGSTHIRSANPEDHPSLIANFLTSAFDQKVSIAAIRAALNIVAQPELAELIERPLSLPEGDLSDEQLLETTLRTGHPGYHASCTCRMGVDPGAVVDPQLRVIGVEGLRVADCAIMPRLVSGNTNAPAMMIGEKAADLILNG